MTLHLADDILRGMEPGTPSSLIAVPILALWLYATLALPERRPRYTLLLLLSLLGAVVPVVHFKVAGGVVHGEIAKSNGAFFFVWTQIALGVSAVFSIPLCVQGLWRPPLGRTQ